MEKDNGNKGMVILKGHLSDNADILRQVENIYNARPEHSGIDQSLLLQELAISMLAEDIAVFVMDIGGSFKDVCQMVGGEVIRLGKVTQPVSELLAGSDKALTVFEFEELAGDRSFMTWTLQNLLLQITIEFMSGNRTSQFVLIVSKTSMMMNIPASFLASLAVVLRAAGGSLAFLRQDSSQANEG